MTFRILAFNHPGAEEFMKQRRGPCSIIYHERNVADRVNHSWSPYD
jgi:hypothetical protein